jgi:hypothetical protein
MTISVWKGPYEDGITQSLIGKFLECPYRAYLYLVLGLEEQTELEPNLMWGDTFHKGLELLIKEPKCIHELTDEDWKSLEGLLREHLDEKFPMAPVTFKYSIPRMLRLYDDSYKENHQYFTEQKFAVKYNNGVILRGKLDAIRSDQEVLVEHKCKGKIDRIQTKAETKDDLQVNLYCMISGARQVIYDIIRVPDTQWRLPTRRNMQTFEKWVDAWYLREQYDDYPIAVKKPLWINQIPITLDESYHQDYIKKTLNPLIDRIERWWEHVNQPGFDPDNPDYYNHIFYKTPIRHFDPGKTERYKCSYWRFLTGEITIDELTPVKGFYEELKNEKLQSYLQGDDSRGISKLTPECLSYCLPRVDTEGSN